MKTAKAMIVTVSVFCPDCGEPIPEPRTGSYVWDVAGDDRWGAGDTARCDECGTTVKLPKNVGETIALGGGK